MLVLTLVVNGLERRLSKHRRPVTAGRDDAADPGEQVALAGKEPTEGMR